MNLFLVESPLQLLSAIEAACFFKCANNYYLIRLSGHKNNDEQLKKLAKDFIINDDIKYVNIRSENRKLLDYIKIFICKFLFYFKINNYQRVFIGNFDSGLLKFLTRSVDKSRVILLDDGAKTINIQRGFNDDFNLDLFSFFNLKPHFKQKIYKNDFVMLKKEISKYELESEVILLGSSLYEIGLLTETQYISYIKKISQYLNEKKIKYIAHRSECKKKLKKIKSAITNLEVEVLSYPVELYAFNKHKKPSLVVSFYSTALFTMKNIYGCEVVSFKFDYKGSKHEDNIDRVYDFYEKNMLVVKL